MINNNYIQGRVIAELRVCMILLVLFQHIKVFHPLMTSRNFHVLPQIQSVISDCIGQIAVPVFFFISGYLYFVNIDKLSYEQYKNKTRSRIKSLFIPYILWNGLYIMIYSLCQSLGMRTIFSKITEWNSIDFFKAFFCFDSGMSPIDGPLWFIRDLFIIFLLSPIFYCILKKSGVFFISLLGGI